MDTLDSFTVRWQERHRFPMDLESDVPFYYALYRQLRTVSELYALHSDDSRLLSILLYVENTVALGLDRSLARLYRVVEDEVGRWGDEMGLSAEGLALVRRLVSNALAEAPESGLRRWLVESIRSGRFSRLGEALRFFVTCDETFARLYPPLSFRRQFFRSLAHEDEQAGDAMLVADLAFNWVDKSGLTLARRLAHLFSGEPLVVDTLLSVRPRQMDAYTVKSLSGEGIVTLANKEGQTFEDVSLSDPLPADWESRCLLAQLVTCLDRTYVSGPVAWHSRKMYDRWGTRRLFYGIEDVEIDVAYDTSFTTRTGEEVCLHTDLFTADIACDEPSGEDPGLWYGLNVWDFLDWLGTRPKSLSEPCLYMEA